MVELDEPGKTNLPQPNSVSSASVHVPNIWIMLLIVPLFVAAIALQGVEVAVRLSNRETTVENAAKMKEFQRAASAYEDQATEWQKLAESSKNQMATAQSEVVKLEAKIKVLTESASVQEALVQESVQSLAGLNKDILAKRNELAVVEADFQVTRSRKQAIENANLDLQKDYVAKKAEAEQLDKKLATLVADVATKNAFLKTQLEQISDNDKTKLELTREKAELTGLKQQKLTISNIHDELKTEADRLTKERGTRLTELKDLQSQIVRKQEELRQLTIERDKLAAEIAKIKDKNDKTDELETRGLK